MQFIQKMLNKQNYSENPYTVIITLNDNHFHVIQDYLATINMNKFTQNYLNFKLYLHIFKI